MVNIAKVSPKNRVAPQKFCDVCQHTVHDLEKHCQTGEHHRNLCRNGESSAHLEASRPDEVVVKASMEQLKGRRVKVLITPRQAEVLWLLMDGKTGAEVANLLKLSVLTVKRLVVYARRRLGARNTTHAVVIALRKGYISLNGEG